MAFSIARVDRGKISCGVRARLKRRLEAAAVVASLVRRLKRVEARTRNGSSDSATSVTIGTVHRRISRRKMATTRWMSESCMQLGILPHPDNGDHPRLLIYRDFGAMNNYVPSSPGNVPCAIYCHSGSLSVRHSC